MNIANKLTTLRLICVPVFISLMVFQQYAVASIVFILASLTDYLDGYLARKLHLVTDFGKFADPLADKLLVMSALILMIEPFKVPAWMVSVIVCRELAVTGLRLLLVQKNIVMAADWSGKMKTVTQMIAITCLLCQNFGLTLPLGNIFLYVCVVLTIYSGVEYFYKYKFIFKDM